MNKIKLSNPVRLIAFFLTALVLLCTFGFGVDGWLINDEEQNIPNDGESANDPDNNVGDNTEQDNEDKGENEPEVTIPEYFNPITGLETNSQGALVAHLGLVLNPELPFYGISSADLVCDVPTEDGGVRTVAFVQSVDNLWKIGSITKTRGYISNIIKYFGGISINSGNDDSIYYTQCDMSGQSLDISLNTGHHYTEYTSNVYTNPSMLESSLNDGGINRNSLSSPVLPYEFIEYGADEVVFSDTYANKIYFEQSVKSVVEIVYDHDSGVYSLVRNGVTVADQMNGKTPEYKNCFILFADSVTYDNKECNQMIMETIGSGSGYYLTNGGYCRISWVGRGDGTLLFTTEDGITLTVNRGTSYISFLRSSRIGDVKFE